MTDEEKDIPCTGHKPMRKDKNRLGAYTPSLIYVFSLLSLLFIHYDSNLDVRLISNKICLDPYIPSLVYFFSLLASLHIHYDSNVCVRAISDFCIRFTGAVRSPSPSSSSKQTGLSCKSYGYVSIGQSALV